MELELRLDPADEEFVERVGRFFEADAAPRTSGRMIGLLLLAPGELSIDEIAERLRVSRASVSTNARQLEQWGIVERVSHTGDRRDYYQISPDIGERTLERALQGIGSMVRRLRQGQQTVAGRSQVVQDRFAGTISFHERAMDVVSDLLGQVRARRG